MVQQQLQFEYSYGLSLPESRDFIIDLPPLVRMVKEDVPAVHLNCPEDVFWKFSKEARTYQQEFLMLIYLTISNRLIAHEVLFLGGMTSAIVDVKIIMRKVLGNEKAARFMLVHNHPSGRANASEHDLLLTKDVMDATNFLGLDFVDHIIIADKEFTSIRRLHKELWGLT